jgi:transcription initiation factor TFIIE subunit alpha
VSFLEEELMKVVGKIGGQDAVKIINILKNFGEATDEMIAKESEIKLNDVRKILYKLYSSTLVTSARVREAKTGWFLYYWRIQLDQLDAFIRSRKRRTIERLKDRLKFEESHEFFRCDKCSPIRIPFEEALDSAFRCTKCGGSLVAVNKTPIINFLKNRINLIESELDE